MGDANRAAVLARRLHSCARLFAGIRRAAAGVGTGHDGGRPALHRRRRLHGTAGDPRRRHVLQRVHGVPHRRLALGRQLRAELAGAEGIRPDGLPDKPDAQGRARKPLAPGIPRRLCLPSQAEHDAGGRLRAAGRFRRAGVDQDRHVAGGHHDARGLRPEAGDAGQPLAADSAKAASDSARSKADRAGMPADTGRAKVDSSKARPDSGRAKADSGRAKPDTGKVKRDTIAVWTDAGRVRVGAPGGGLLAAVHTRDASRGAAQPHRSRHPGGEV